MEKLKEFLNYSFNLTDGIHLNVKTILVVTIVFVLTSLCINLIRKFVNKSLNEEDKGKFKAVFSFVKYVIYTVVLVIALESSGIKVGVLLAGSAALLVGIGLGLQTLFQDIVSGIFIILDKSLHVNDIIEIDEKVGKVAEIRLRTTRAITIDDKVLIIPNHKFLTTSLFNWTQNGSQTTESVAIGVAYGSDVALVKTLLIDVAKAHPRVLTLKEPRVLFDDFGDSALQFKLLFVINNSFEHLIIKSDLRFAIDQKFRENNISIPFPQRDVHLIK
ncbi:mechanosensitive ion channel family protein [Polaribacter sp. L3A8]|uniref:mechanosensitive ion channel family protein n=1 Tax=Polaribacter sp. L3A8 TaxID=2686361 RepID=UPI00131ECC91|nr:mechanosensitive ion channel domain-containing protein [Polaribacter sp. L3A8]